MSTIKARIGLFGGSFNPVHKGHINIVNHSFEKLRLDEVIFIPCYKSVDKDSGQYASVFHRIAMLLEVLPRRCSISTFEVDQFREVETIETLKYFKEIYGEAELFFLMGEDTLSTIYTWKEYEKLDEYANLVVFRRDGSNIKKQSFGLKVRWMENDFWNYSASTIRNNKLSGLDLKVELYLRENKLYGYVG